MTTKLVKRKRPRKGRVANSIGLHSVVSEIESQVSQVKFPKFGPGDQVKVHVRIKEGNKERIQVYEGIVIKSKSARDHGGSFTVRKVSHGVGVERVFLRKSPRIAKVEVVYPGKVRRAKLYYVRRLEGKAAKIDRDLDAGTSARTTASGGSESKAPASQSEGSAS